MGASVGTTRRRSVTCCWCVPLLVTDLACRLDLMGVVLSIIWGALLLATKSSITRRGMFGTAVMPGRLDKDQYYILELCLTPAQRTLFRSQLSARPEGSDAYLKSLTGVADEARRGSFAPALTSSTERAQLFQFHLTCIEAFLQMETGPTRPRSLSARRASGAHQAEG